MAMTFGKLDFAVAFNRQTAFPLDAKSYFESLAAAQAAAATAEEAGSSSTTYYYGQTVAVVENSIATLYVIQPDKTLKEVGSGKSQPMKFVADEAEMLALQLTNEDVGQQVYREDTHTVWIYKGGDASQLANWVESSGQVNLDATFDNTNGNIKVGSGNPATLTNVAHGITYDSTALKITIPQYGSSDLVINIPKDKFVTAGKYYEAYPEPPATATHHKVIVLTIDNQTEPVIIPAESLVNVYTADNTGKNVEITISDDYKISANISLAGTADDAGKILVASADGKSIEYGSAKLSDLATTAAITELLKTKRDIVTPTADGVLVYAVTKNGDTVTQGNLVVGNVANGLVRFDDGQRIQVANPVADTDAANKGFVNTTVNTAIAGVTFENKAVLAAITQEKVDAWDANVTYVNGKKTVLDAITEDKITEWNNKLSTVPVDNVSIELNASQEVAVKAVNVNKLDQTAGDELILDGGTAN